jgi:lysophospholipase L1-like esterase
MRPTSGGLVHILVNQSMANVTIMLGTNDAKAFNWEGVQQDTGNYFALDYVSMINELRQLKKTPRIFIMIPPPLYEPYPFEMNATIINNVFSTLHRDIAGVMDLEIIDIHGALLPYGDLTCDGCHPIHDGNIVIANTIANTILGENNVPSVTKRSGHSKRGQRHNKDKNKDKKRSKRGVKRGGK